MHRKSQEAADALNNDDSGNSDREDAQSKCSDISITNLSTTSANNKTSHNKSGAASSGHTPTSMHNESSARHSVTPTSAASPSAAAKLTSSPSMTTTPSPHHLTSIESAAAAAAAAAHKNDLPPPPLVGSPPHGHYHPDTDPEAFRWVDYSRDPISFIRCDFFFHLQHPRLCLLISNNGQYIWSFLSIAMICETNCIFDLLTIRNGHTPSRSRILTYFSSLFYRNNSIAALRAKAQEHQARLLNSGLLLQVRSLAGLQSPVSQSPQSCDSNANNLVIGAGHHSPHDHHPHNIDLHARSYHHAHPSPGPITASPSVKSEHTPTGINMTAF